MNALILASSSPRRSQLLREMGIPFTVVTAAVEELDGTSGLTPVALARENAQRKAEAVASTHPEQLVLGADTVVALGSRILGKPASLDQGREFLTSLSGQTHEVITGVALACPGKSLELREAISRVTFRTLTPEIISRYLEAVPVLDKAGGYALQENGDWIIERVEGSRSNVVGLPVELVEEMLRG